MWNLPRCQIYIKVAGAHVRIGLSVFDCEREHSMKSHSSLMPVLPKPLVNVQCALYFIEFSNNWPTKVQWLILKHWLMFHRISPLDYARLAHYCLVGCVLLGRQLSLCGGNSMR